MPTKRILVKASTVHTLKAQVKKKKKQSKIILSLKTYQQHMFVPEKKWLEVDVLLLIVILDLKIRALTTTLLLPSAFWGTSADICSKPNYSFCSKLALLQK